MKRFGEYIDTYRLMDAVNDGATLQILYEGKTADTALNEKHEFETKFEDLFRDRSEEELLAIKKKYGATGDILEAEQRIAAIARTWSTTMSTIFCPTDSRPRWSATPSWRRCATRRPFEAALPERLAEGKAKAMPDLESDQPDRLSEGRGGDFLRRHQRGGLCYPGAQTGQAVECGGEFLQAVRLHRPG